MEWTPDNSHIQLDNGRIVEFPSTIKEVTVIGRLLVIVLKPAGQPVNTENVYGLTLDGEILWQVAPNGAPKGNVDCYVGVVRHSDGRVWVAKWSTWVYEVDLATGAILGGYFGK